MKNKVMQKGVACKEVKKLNKIKFFISTKVEQKSKRN